MSIVSVTQTSSETSGRDSSGRTRTVEYDVVISSPVDETPDSVLVSGQVPVYGEAAADDPSLIVRKVSARRAGKLLIRVTVEYRTTSLETGDSGVSPLDLPARYSSRTVGQVVKIDRDVEGNPIVNVNGEAFDDPPSTDIYDIDLLFTQNLNITREQSIALQDEFIDKVNSAPFLGVAAGRLRITDISMEEVRDEAPFPFFRMSVAITLRRVLAEDVEPDEAWALRIREEGYYVSSTGEPGKALVRAVDSEDQPFEKPVLLDPMTGEQATEAAWKAWKVKDEIDFAGLQLNL